jgi:TIR domain
MNRPAVLTRSALERTNLVRILRDHLEPSELEPREGSGPHIRYLPWHSATESRSRHDLEELAGALQVPLVILPSHYSVTQDARLLQELATKLCWADHLSATPDAIQQLRKALEVLPYSSSLEDSALARIKGHARQKCLIVATLTVDEGSDSALSRMLAWTAQLDLKAVLVLAQRKPSAHVKTLVLPLRDLYEDIHSLMPSPYEPTALERTIGSVPGNTPSVPSGIFTSFYRNLLAFLKRSTTRGGTRLEKQAPPPESADPTLDDPETATTEQWAELLARVSAPNWAVAWTIAEGWRTLYESLHALESSARDILEELASSVQDRDERSTVSDKLILTNKEERDILEGRLRFLTLLKGLYPQVSDATLHELDGADQLYRLHLILCGQAASDSLLSSSLLPFWQRHLEDPLFRELFHACFHSIGRAQTLVARFESRSQLQRLLRLADGGAQSQHAQPNALETLARAHAKWVARLAGRTESEDSRAQQDSAAPPGVSPIRAEALKGRDEIYALARDIPWATLSATDALQAAQLLLSAYELSCEVRDGTEEALFGAIQDLTQTAIGQSRGAIRTDAALLRARALALRGQRDEAAEILRVLRRTSQEPLTRCAVKVEEAFVEECERDYWTATRLYQEALNVAESLGADELVARAAGGCLRCDVASSAKVDASTLPMRARIVIQIQSARAPELFPMSRRNKPTLFISYRRHTRRVTQGMQQALRNTTALEAWSDVLLHSDEDFSPVIHRRLHDSDAIVLLLSPCYFNSPWCVHELHFALGQYELRGVPLYWAWCAETSDASLGVSHRPPTRCSCAQLAQHSIEASFERTRTRELGYELHHIRDRLKRLFAYGQLLSPTPVPYTPVLTPLPQASSLPESPADTPSDDPELALHLTKLVEPLRRAQDYLYRRAKLTYKTTWRTDDGAFAADNGASAEDLERMGKAKPMQPSGGSAPMDPLDQLAPTAEFEPLEALLTAAGERVDHAGPAP